MTQSEVEFYLIEDQAKDQVDQNEYLWRRVLTIHQAGYTFDSLFTKYMQRKVGTRKNDDPVTF